MNDFIKQEDALETLLSFKNSRAVSVDDYDFGFEDGLGHAIRNYETIN